MALVRVTPLVHQYPLNDKLYYPIYAACTELELPVSVNVGIPGPRVRSACQHPELLEDVLIDFKGLTVIGAHMGHPYEALLMQYMLKWPDLYLSNSAYLAKYMDPALVSFMGSKRGFGRVLFASDHPFLPMERAMDAAPGPAALNGRGGGVSGRHGDAAPAPRLNEPATVGPWTSADSVCGGAARGASPTAARSTPPLRSRRSGTARCGRRAASTAAWRATSSVCSPPRNG